jgi:hypothetical protein
LRKDVIVEIKFLAKLITSQYIVDTLDRIALKLRKYPNPHTRPVAIFVMEDISTFNEPKILEEASALWSAKTIRKWNLIFTDMKKLPAIRLKDEVLI